MLEHFHIYRGRDGVIDHNTIVAEMAIDAAQVNVPAQSFEPGSVYHYVRCQVSECGLESPDSDACVVIADSTGDLVGNMPNAPIALTIEQLAGGKFRLRWRYSYVDEDYPPNGFNIYIDTGSGFDFNDPDATITVGRVSAENSWISAAYTNGQVVKFCVRSFVSGTSGGESQNTNFASGVADSVGPPAITGLTSVVEDI